VYGNDVANKIMTRNRFQILLRNWHFADNANANVEDRTHKVKDLLTMLIAKFANARSPAEEIVVDESMIPFRGRLLFKQYLPGKAHKYGVKVFKLCDKNGYTFNAAIYTGKTDAKLSVPTTVVLRLSQPYLNAGRTLVTDNYFTSIELANKLLDMQSHLVGTLRVNRRGLPRTVTTASLKKGEVRAAENRAGIVIQKWKDKRDVLILSTKHGGNLVSVGKKNKHKEEIVKPAAVVFYNSVKQGIDISDQMSSYHSPIRKTVKWYHKVAEELLFGTTVVNAWILYNDHCISCGRPDKKLQITAFREYLVKSLLEWHDGNAHLADRTDRCTSVHFLQVIAAILL
jgi:Transposase IS4